MILRLVPPFTLLFLMSAVIIGCSSVYVTTSLDEYTQSTNAKACGTNAGMYALPKALLSFNLTKSTGPSYRYILSEVDTSISADENHRYCLDYRGNSFAKDAIAVKRNNVQLLEEVSSSVEDISDDVIVSAVEGGALLAAQIASNGAARNLGNPDAGTPATVMQLKFDPFDAEVLTHINQQLIRRGYCIYIDPDGDPFVPGWMANQCSNRKSYSHATSKTDSEAFFDRSTYQAGQGRLGILYRPVLPHTLVILKRDDPTSPISRWRVWRRKVLELPNRAPTFMVEVKRSLFTERTTIVKFKNGTLDNISVDKKSELNAASNVVVRVVEVIVQVPVIALLITTNKANNSKALIETNQALIQTLKDLKDSQNALQERLAGLTPEQQAQAAAYGLRTSRTRMLAENLEACVRNLPSDGSIEDPERYCAEIVQ